MTAAFAPPGPGQWALDRSHFAGGTTPICQWLMEESMARGTRRVFTEIGVPADTLQARFVNGFMYTRLRPLLRPDHAATKLPPSQFSASSPTSTRRSAAGPRQRRPPFAAGPGSMSRSGEPPSSGRR